jgi:hypothetical protein
MKIVSIAFVAVSMTGCGSNGKRSLPHNILNSAGATESELAEYIKTYGKLSVEECTNKLKTEMLEIVNTRDGLTSTGNKNVDELKASGDEKMDAQIQYTVDVNCDTLTKANKELNQNGQI